MDAAEKLRYLVATINASAWIPNSVGERLMAKQVQMAAGAKFQFRSGKSEGEQKYAWDEWLNGDLLMIEQSIGEKDEKGTVVKVREKRDYDVNTDAMPGKLKSAARRRKRVVEISRVDADGQKLVNALIIRSREMTPDEEAAEMKLREKEKEERKAKLAAAVAADNAAVSNGEPTSEEPTSEEQKPAPAPRRRK